MTQRIARRSVLARITQVALASTPVIVGSGTLHAQGSIASRIAGIRNGTVQMEYVTRAGVCGDGHDVVAYRSTLYTRDSETRGRWSGVRCVAGNARVAVDITDGAPSALRVRIGGDWPDASGPVTTLGVVSAHDASAWLLAQLPKLEGASSRDRTIVAAAIADDPAVAAALLGVARDEARLERTRSRAIEWLGLVGDASYVPALVTFAKSDAGNADDDARHSRRLASAAAAALGELPDDAGVPALLELLRSGAPLVRRDAAFWLANNGSPRAIAAVRAVAENAAEDTKLRTHAIFSLGHVVPESASQFAWLRGLYSRLDNDKLKEAVIQALAQDDREGRRFLLGVARDGASSIALRKNALFWLGQNEDTPTSDIVAVYDDAKESALREHAIFVLSQRQDESATDALMRIARSDSDRRMQSKALFWLGQKHDPRVTKLISDLVLK